MILSFRTDRPRSNLIWVCTVCHSVCIVWTHYSMVEPHSSNFRVITTNFWGVLIFKKFTVLFIASEYIFVDIIVHYRSWRKENSSEIPAHRIYQSVKLFLQPIKLREISIMMRSWNYTMGQVMRKHVLSHMRTTKVQISLPIRAVWSAPLFFTA